jgi:hypothetical protein
VVVISVDSLSCLTLGPKGSLIIFLILLGAFAKLRKATSSFVMPVRVSVIMEQLGSHWKDFQEMFEYFSKICPENSSATKI